MRHPPATNGKDEIQRASTAARIGMVALGAALLLAVYLGETYAGALRDWVGADPEKVYERVLLLVLLVAVFSVPMLAVGMLYVYHGARAVASERFPPAGMAVIADTPVRHGDDARRKGRRLQIGGVTFCIVAIGFPTVLYILVRGMIASV